MTIANLRGAVLRPGVWFGETPLQQYGMAEIRLVLLDGTALDGGRFLQVVDRVLTDVTTAAAHCRYRQEGRMVEARTNADGSRHDTLVYGILRRECAQLTEAGQTGD